MEFCYAAVLRKDIPLAQHCPRPGNFDLFFQRYTEKNKLEVGKTKLKSDNFLWGIQYEEEGLTFLCVLKQTDDEDLLDKALDDIKSRFVRSHGSDWRKASPFGLQTTFEPQLILVKQSLMSVAGVGVIPQNLPPIDELEDDSLDQNLIDDSTASKFDPSLTDGNLIVKLDPVPLDHGHHNWKEIIIWTLVIVFGVILIYLVLVIICGGLNLSPRCIK